MGLDISKITNATLKAIAQEYDIVKSDNILDETEFYLFKMNAEKPADVTDAEWSQAFGLYVSNPNNPNDITAKKEITEATKEEKAEEKTTRTKLPNDGLNDHNRSILKGRLVSYNTIDDVINGLNDDVALQANVFKTAKETTLTLANEIKNMNINSKKDVDAIKDKIKDKYKNFKVAGYNNNILNRLVDIAEKEQIEKERINLINLYIEIKVKDENKAKTFDELEEVLKAEMPKKGYKESYYTGKAYTEFKQYLLEDAKSFDDLNLSNAFGHTNRTEGTTSKAIRKEKLATVKEKYKNDSVLRDAIIDDKADRKIEAKYNKFRQRTEELKNVTAQTLRENFGYLSDSTEFQATELYTKMKNKFQKDDDTIDTDALIKLQAELRDVVGTDLTLNHSDNPNISEMSYVQEKLEKVFGLSFDTSEVKKLIKFLGFDYKTERDRVGSVGENAGTGALTGTVASASTGVSLKAAQTVSIRVTVAQADAIKNSLAGKAVETVTGQDGTVVLKVLQNMSIDTHLISALAGAGIGALFSALFTLAVGEKVPFERACYSQTELSSIVRNAGSFEEAKEAIAKKYPGARGTILAALAEKAYKQDSKNWVNIYLNQLDKVAGEYSNMNCEELRATKFDETILAEEKEVKENKSLNVSYSIKEDEAIAESKEKVEIETIDARTSSWEKLAEQYSCIGKTKFDASKYPNCARRKGELAVRMLKVAQAINDNDYSLDRLLYLAEETFKSRNYEYESLKDYPGIDHKVLQGTMQAELMGDVKMPSQLADCTRESKEIKANISKELRTGTKSAVGYAEDFVTKAGKAAVYYVKFSDGTEQTFNAAQHPYCNQANPAQAAKEAREKAIDEFMNKYGSENVTCTRWEE